MAAAVTAPWTGTKLAGVPPTDILLIIAAVLLAIYFIIGRRKMAIRVWTLAPTLGAVAVLAFDALSGRIAGAASLGASALGDAETSAFVFVGRTLLATFVMFVIVESEVRAFGRPAARRLLLAFIAGVIASVLAAGYTSQTGVVLVDPQGIDVSSRAIGLAGHPNSLAQSIVLAIAATGCVVYLCAPGVRRAVFATMTLGLLGWGLLLADSRGALAVGAVVAAVLCLGALARVQGGRWVVPAGILLVLGSLAVWPSYVAGTRLEAEGLFGASSMSNVARADYLEAAFEAFAANPLFGAGLAHGTSTMVPAYLLSAGGLVLLGGYSTYVLVAFTRQWRWKGPIPQPAASLGVGTVVLMGLPNNSVNERFDYIVLACVVSMSLWLFEADSAPALRRNARTRSARRRQAPTTGS